MRKHVPIAYLFLILILIRKMLMLEPFFVCLFLSVSSHYVTMDMVVHPIIGNPFSGVSEMCLSAIDSDTGIGFFGSKAGSPFVQVHKYDFLKKNWTRMSDSPFKRLYCSAARYTMTDKTEVVIIAGIEPFQQTFDIRLYRLHFISNLNKIKGPTSVLASSQH